MQVCITQDIYRELFLGVSCRFVSLRIFILSFFGGSFMQVCFTQDIYLELFLGVSCRFVSLRIFILSCFREFHAA